MLVVVLNVAAGAVMVAALLVIAYLRQREKLDESAKTSGSTSRSTGTLGQAPATRLETTDGIRWTAPSQARAVRPWRRWRGLLKEGAYASTMRCGTGLYGRLDRLEDMIGESHSATNTRSEIGRVGRN